MHNEVTLIGFLGQDPEVVNFQNGGSIAKTTLATSEKWFDKATNQTKSNTEWHNIVFRFGQVELASKYLRKGSKIFVKGKIHYRSYDNQNGEKRYITEIYVNDLVFLDNKPQEGNSYQQQEYPNPPQAGRNQNDLPF